MKQKLQVIKVQGFPKKTLKLMFPKLKGNKLIKIKARKK